MKNTKTTYPQDQNGWLRSITASAPDNAHEINPDIIKAIARQLRDAILQLPDNELLAAAKEAEHVLDCGNRDQSHINDALSALRTAIANAERPKIKKIKKTETSSPGDASGFCAGAWGPAGQGIQQDPHDTHRFYLELCEERDNLRKQRDELMADNRRLDWLQHEALGASVNATLDDLVGRGWSSLRSAIDAAIANTETIF